MRTEHPTPIPQLLSSVLMYYRTIVLELLQEQTTLHERLRESQTLMQAVDRCAAHLKSRHEFWITELRHSKTAMHQSQLSSSALELAIQEFRDDLTPETTEDDTSALTLDEAMAFLRRLPPSN